MNAQPVTRIFPANHHEKRPSRTPQQTPNVSEATILRRRRRFRELCFDVIDPTDSFTKPFVKIVADQRGERNTD